MSDAVWRPYCQMKTASPPLRAVRTEGSRIHLADGRVLVDGVASWWTACHGYNHLHIQEAVRRQLSIMPHVMFGGLTHEPAEQLATRLSAILPPGLQHVFFCDSGSVAVEVAMKMAVQFWLNRGKRGRTRFVAFRGAYHGDTLGAMSACDPVDGMHAHFGEWMPRQLFADIPRTDSQAHDFERLLRAHREEIAAVVIEPLVQGAGGMRFHDAAALGRVAATATRCGALLIADEIFTGFGRTGHMFACEEAGIVPDILCLSKALTGGTLPLAATIASREVFSAFWSDDPAKALMHGPTFMANPLACAAANASLDLFEQEPRLEQARTLEKKLADGLSCFRDIKNVVDVRAKGAIGVVQFDRPPDREKLKSELISRGAWIRPFGDILYLAPALTIADEDLSILFEAIAGALAHRS
jgi:adenosylmethionine---8-amino-7-oxononanoate aminotransferase